MEAGEGGSFEVQVNRSSGWVPIGRYDAREEAERIANEARSRGEQAQIVTIAQPEDNNRA